jgi:hypothetical protein
MFCDGMCWSVLECTSMTERKYDTVACFEKLH